MQVEACRGRTRSLPGNLCPLPLRRPCPLPLAILPRPPARHSHSDAIGPVPKLRTPDETTKPAMAELVKSARTLSADSHQAVAGAAVKVIGALASGLRAAFAPWALASFRALVARAKDKKAIAGVTTAPSSPFSSPSALSFSPS